MRGFPLADELLFVLPSSASLHLVLLCTYSSLATGVAGGSRSFDTFPTAVSWVSSGAPQPLFPFTIHGAFTIPAQGATEVRRTRHSTLVSFTDGGSDQNFTGFKLALEGEAQLVFRLANGRRGALAVSLAQQRNLDDGREHAFVAVAMKQRIQVRVDGLIGTSAVDGCKGSDPTSECDFADNGYQLNVGVDPCCRNVTLFRGKISDFGIRRMDSGERPRPTAADGGQPGPSPVPAPTEVNGGSDAIFLILILSLIAILVFLVSALAFLYTWSKQEERRKVVAIKAASATRMQVPIAGGPSPVPIGVAGASAGAKKPSLSAPPPQFTSASNLAAEDVAWASLPAWWTAKPPCGKHELVSVSEEVRQAVQELMNTTWRDTVTRDRHILQATGSVNTFEVVQVNRNENTMIFQNYARRRKAIGEELRKEDLLSGILTEDAGSLGERVSGSNEYLLFHGSRPSAVAGICENDFQLKKSGSHRGTLYGPGLYFAESSSKADEYAEDDTDGIYRGLYAMLLCRVTLGKSLYTDEVRVDGEALKQACSGPQATHHSVLGDREKARGTYREFIVYTSDQAYPEYVVIYRRVDKKPTE